MGLDFHVPVMILIAALSCTSSDLVSELLAETSVQYSAIEYTSTRVPVPSVGGSSSRVPESFGMRLVFVFTFSRAFAR